MTAQAIASPEMIVHDNGTSACVGSLIAVLGDLADVLGAETDALVRRQPARIAELADRKEKLALAYADQVKTLRGRPAALRNAEPSSQRQLESVSKRFHAILGENMNALSVAKRAHEGLARAIGKAVNKSETATKGYSGNGAYRHREAVRPNTVPVAIDQQF